MHPKPLHASYILRNIHPTPLHALQRSRNAIVTNRRDCRTGPVDVDATVTEGRSYEFLWELEEAVQKVGCAGVFVGESGNELCVLAAWKMRASAGIDPLGTSHGMEIWRSVGMDQQLAG
jgi:hypothetical protein